MKLNLFTHPIVRDFIRVTTMPENLKTLAQISAFALAIHLLVKLKK